MSHEGIRIVSEREARQASAFEVKLPPEAVTPQKVRVHKTEGTGVEIDWRDGPSQRLELRLATQCLPLRHVPRRAGTEWPSSGGAEA